MTKPNGVGRRKGMSARAQMARNHYRKVSEQRRIFMQALDYLSAAIRGCCIADKRGRLLPIESVVGRPLQSAATLKRDLPSLWAISPATWRESPRRPHLAEVSQTGFIVIRVQPTSALRPVQSREGCVELDRLEMSA